MKLMADWSIEAPQYVSEKFYNLKKYIKMHPFEFQLTVGLIFPMYRFVVEGSPVS